MTPAAMRCVPTTLSRTPAVWRSTPDSGLFEASVSPAKCIITRAYMSGGGEKNRRGGAVSGALA